MSSLSDKRQQIERLLADVREEKVSRRSSIKILGWLGLTIPAAMALLENPIALLAGAKPDRRPDQEIERLLKELKQAVDEYNAKVDAMDDDDEVLNDQKDENVYLQLTYPAGKSPKVFQTGWLFGAKCLFKPAHEDDEPFDASASVEWGGTASFSPAKGASSRPTFKGIGSNTIVLAVNYKGKRITRTMQVQVVSPAGYAHVGSIAACQADSHGCPACPHPVRGPVELGSPQVLINGKPAARLGDSGTHSACCGPNRFTIAEGDPTVLINGKPAARSGGKTIHCGGVGNLV